MIILILMCNINEILILIIILMCNDNIWKY